MRVSFEFFPPRDTEAAFRLAGAMATLAPFAPHDVTVTYGAGGTSREASREAVAALARTAPPPVAAHLTCVGQSRADVLAEARALREAGAYGIVALRGDPPKGADRFAPHPDGFADAVELTAALARDGHDRILVAAYPETHPDAPDAASGLAWLKAKQDAGATEAVTQFFFQADTFLRFRDAAVLAGVTIPIRAGLLPVANWPATVALARRCGAAIPPTLAEAFERAEAREDVKGATRLLALATATTLAEKLRAGGADHLHVYTLNRGELAADLCTALGLSPEAAPLRRIA